MCDRLNIMIFDQHTNILIELQAQMRCLSIIWSTPMSWWWPAQRHIPTMVGLCSLNIMLINNPTNTMTMIPPISRSNYMHTCVLGPMPGLLHTTGDLVIAPQVIEMHWIRIWSNWFRCQEMYRDISVTFNSMDTWSDRFTFHGMHGMNEIKYMQWDIHHWPKCKFRHDLCYDGQSIVTGIV